MNIQPVGETVLLPTQPAESSTEGLVNNIQYLGTANESLLSQQSFVVSHQVNTDSPLRKDTYHPSNRVEKMADIARKWGIQDIDTVEIIANRLNCTLNELTYLSPENIFLHRSTSQHNTESNCITKSQSVERSRYFPNGGVPMLISLERRVSNPYAKTGHVAQMCKLSDVLHSGSKITNNLVAYDTRAVVVVIPPEVSIPTETLAAYEKSLQLQYEANITTLASKWETQDIESVKTIASALNIGSHNLANFLNIPAENIHLRLTMDQDQVVIHNNTLTNNIESTPDKQNSGVSFKVSLENTKESRNAITCKLSNILQTGGKITHDRSSYSVWDVVELPKDISIPFESSAIQE
ncbi:MAG: hypothetical protein PW844_10200 [Pantoea sp.]|uniref:hypothetical protein n=1 Tax=Pantoea sp. TaxID=69393 RepID=UPI00238BBDD2|nr:hypothetical protein [Pantoea sp.]MDE1186839.1 hypothetical protein [Pantoea sp.]